MTRTKPKTADTDRPSDSLAADRAHLVAEIALMLSDATSPDQAAAILKPLPKDIASDGLWRCMRQDLEQVAGHKVQMMRLQDHADMLRSVTRSGGSHLDADIAF